MRRCSEQGCLCGAALFVFPLWHRQGCLVLAALLPGLLPGAKPPHLHQIAAHLVVAVFFRPVARVIVKDPVAIRVVANADACFLPLQQRFAEACGDFRQYLAPILSHRHELQLDGSRLAGQPAFYHAKRQMLVEHPPIVRVHVTACRQFIRQRMQAFPKAVDRRSFFRRRRHGRRQMPVAKEPGLPFRELKPVFASPAPPPIMPLAVDKIAP